MNKFRVVNVDHIFMDSLHVAIFYRVTDEDLRDLARSFGVTPNPKFLSTEVVTN